MTGLARRNHVAVATFEWVDFFNNQRPHESPRGPHPGALASRSTTLIEHPSPKQGEAHNHVPGRRRVGSCRDGSQIVFYAR